MVRVHQQLGPDPRTRPRHLAQPVHDPRVPEEHRRHQHRGRPVVHRPNNPLGDRVARVRQPLRSRDSAFRPTVPTSRHLHDLDPLGLEPVQLPPNRMELPVRGDEPRPLAQRQRRQEPDKQLVSILPQRDVAVRVVQQQPEPGPYVVGDLESPPPLVVHMFGGVEPGLLLGGKCHVRPRLVGVPGEQYPFRDPEAGIVRGQGGRGSFHQGTLHPSLKYRLAATSPPCVENSYSTDTQ